MLADLAQVLRLSRPFDAIYPVVSLLVGAAAVGQLTNSGVLWLVVVVAILNSVAMIWNDIEDRSVDADNGRAELRRAKRAVLRRLVVYTVIFAVVAVAMSWLVSYAALILSLVALGITWIYNSLPIQASRRPIASITVLSGAGAFLPFLYGISLDENFDVALIIAGFFWWLGRVSLSVLKDYKDALGDSLHGKKTFLLCYGARWVARVSVASFVVGYGGFVAVMSVGERNDWRLGLAACLIAGSLCLMYARRTLFVRKASYNTLDKTFRKVAQYQILLDAGIVVWLM